MAVDLYGGGSTGVKQTLALVEDKGKHTVLSLPRAMNTKGDNDENIRNV